MKRPMESRMNCYHRRRKSPPKMSLESQSTAPRRNPGIGWAAENQIRKNQTQNQGQIGFRPIDFQHSLVFGLGRMPCDGMEPTLHLQTLENDRKESAELNLAIQRRAWKAQLSDAKNLRSGWANHIELSCSTRPTREI